MWLSETTRSVGIRPSRNTASDQNCPMPNSITESENTRRFGTITTVAEVPVP